ncbi:hypothetical protein L209DRAFT_241888 [Thermothelomyces heterothallicus CBS 203.75]
MRAFPGPNNTRNPPIDQTTSRSAGSWARHHNDTHLGMCTRSITDWCTEADVHLPSFLPSTSAVISADHCLSPPVAHDDCNEYAAAKDLPAWNGCAQIDDDSKTTPSKAKHILYNNYGAEDIGPSVGTRLYARNMRGRLRRGDRHAAACMGPCDLWKQHRTPSRVSRLNIQDTD